MTSRRSDEQKVEDRAVARWCVVCLLHYSADERPGLHVYPDGCTAHVDCDMSEQGAERRYWHDLDAGPTDKENK